jgi:hypothetical protein
LRHFPNSVLDSQSPCTQSVPGAWHESTRWRRRLSGSRLEGDISGSLARAIFAAAGPPKTFAVEVFEGLLYLKVSWACGSNLQRL